MRRSIDPLTRAANVAIASLVLALVSPALRAAEEPSSRNGLRDSAAVLEQHASALAERFDQVEAALIEAAEHLESDPRASGRLVASAASRLEHFEFETIHDFFENEGREPPAKLVELAERLDSLRTLAADLEAELVAATTPYRPGDADGDLDVDFADAISTLEYLYSGGPTPECFLGADATRDGTLDLSDVVRGLQIARGVGDAPEPRLTIELERAENAGCPWAALAEQHDTVRRKSDECPDVRLCGPQVPTCIQVRDDTVIRVCWWGICWWVPTCVYNTCCGSFCQDTCTL